jgi:hypothetical protein
MPGPPWGKEREASFGTNGQFRLYWGMRRDLNMELIFPIRDEPSAWLMSLKAECLYKAGVLSESEKQAVQDRANRLPTGQFAAGVFQL